MTEFHTPWVYLGAILFTLFSPIVLKTKGKGYYLFSTLITLVLTTYLFLPNVFEPTYFIVNPNNAIYQLSGVIIGGGAPISAPAYLIYILARKGYDVKVQQVVALILGVVLSYFVMEILWFTGSILYMFPQPFQTLPHGSVP